MKPIRRPSIDVEQLEDRNCPSLSITLNGSTLFVNGLPTPNSSSGVQLTQTAPSTFQVLNNGVNLGRYVASNVSLNLVNHNHTPINIDLGGFTETGNLTVKLGTGAQDPTASSTKGVGLFNGKVSGNVLVSGGGGNENLLLGQDTKGNQQANNLVIGGNLYFNGKSNPGAIGDLLDTGANRNLTPIINIGGNVVTNAVNAVVLQANTTVGGSVTINGGGDRIQGSSGTFLAALGGKVGGNYVINGSPGSPGEEFAMFDLNTGVGGTVGGNLILNFGQGANTVFLGGTVGNNASITAGNGVNTINTGAGAGNTQINGSMNVNLGSGNNVFNDLNAGGNGISSTTFVNGNMSIQTGNGANKLGTIASTEFGNLSIHLGNGTNPNVTLTGPVFGTFYWTSGNGGDTLTIPGGPALTTTTYTVNIQFGNGDDTLNVGGGGGTLMLTGRADGGGRLLGNLFNPAPGFIFTQNFILTNFP